MHMVIARKITTVMHAMIMPACGPSALIAFPSTPPMVVTISPSVTLSPSVVVIIPLVVGVVGSSVVVVGLLVVVVSSTSVVVAVVGLVMKAHFWMFTYIPAGVKMQVETCWLTNTTLE